MGSSNARAGDGPRLRKRESEPNAGAPGVRRAGAIYSRAPKNRMVSGTLRRWEQDMEKKNKGKKGAVLHRVAQNTVLWATGKKRQKANKHRVIEDSDFLTEEELEKLFAVAKKRSARDHAIFRVAFCKALRASEVGMLQLSDYDSRANTLQVHRLKGSNSGTLPLFTGEQAAVRAWLKIRGSRPGALFLSRHNRRSRGGSWII